MKLNKRFKESNNVMIQQATVVLIFMNKKKQQLNICKQVHHKATYIFPL